MTWCIWCIQSVASTPSSQCRYWWNPFDESLSFPYFTVLFVVQLGLLTSLSELRSLLEFKKGITIVLSLMGPRLMEPLHCLYWHQRLPNLGSNPLQRPHRKMSPPSSSTISPLTALSSSTPSSTSRYSTTLASLATNSPVASHPHSSHSPHFSSSISPTSGLIAPSLHKSLDQRSQWYRPPQPLPQTLMTSRVIDLHSNKLRANVANVLSGLCSVGHVIGLLLGWVMPMLAEKGTIFGVLECSPSIKDHMRRSVIPAIGLLLN